MRWPCPDRWWPTWSCSHVRVSASRLFRTARSSTAATFRAWLRTSWAPRHAALHVRARQLGGRRRPAAIESTLSGSTRTPASGVTNSGGPPTRVATTSARSPSPRAGPARTARRGWAARARRTPRSSRRRVGAGRGRRGESRGLPCELSEAGGRHRSVPAAPRRDARARLRAKRVLTIVERAHEEEERGPSPSQPTAAALPRDRGAKAPEVDAAVDDFDLAVELGQLTRSSRRR